MSLTRSLFVAVAILGLGSFAVSQEPELPGPEPEHALLQRFVGDWTTSGECDGGPNAEPMVNHGTIRGRMLGERWIVCEHEMDAAGMKVTANLTLGYDPVRKKYVGTWVDSMQNHLFVYEGEYDADSRTLSLFTEGPNLMTGEGTVRFRDSYEFVSEDEIVARSAAQGEDGEWAVFMTGAARRAKP